MYLLPAHVSAACKTWLQGHASALSVLSLHVAVNIYLLTVIKMFVKAEQFALSKYPRKGLVRFTPKWFSNQWANVFRVAM